jgi:hypothetical protein
LTADFLRRGIDKGKNRGRDRGRGGIETMSRKRWKNSGRDRGRGSDTDGRSFKI